MPRPALTATVLALACVPALLAAAGCGAGGDGGGGAADEAVVRRVVDGDTLVVGDDTRVRLIGIDTPESVDPRQPVECFGREAAARTAALVPPGTRVTLERDVERRDRFGRELAYVYRASDGLFVNAELVRTGFAVPFTVPPNVARRDLFQRLGREAREAGRGLWASCPPPR